MLGKNSYEICNRIITCLPQAYFLFTPRESLARNCVCMTIITKRHGSYNYIGDCKAIMIYLKNVPRYLRDYQLATLKLNRR